MKKLIAAIFLLPGIFAQAQIGIGTTSPNSTLDVRGSFSLNYTSFTTATTAGAADNTLVFTGTLPATLTLPTAVGITGRVYNIKNASSNASVLTIATTSSQTIDGSTTLLLNNSYETVALSSNGANWLVTGFGMPSGSGTYWSQGGNAVAGVTNLGTTSAYALPFITSNTERMRITSTGTVGIGTSTFNGTYPEKLLVDAGSTGNTNYQNVIVGKGNTNSYAQLNIQNYSTGTAASSDVVATANNGSETINYIDMGINGGGNTSTGALGGANTAYLYTTGSDFAIGNATDTKNINFFTSASGVYTERMRIEGSGDVGIGNSAPSEKLDITGNLKFSGALMPGGSAGNVGYFLVSTGSGSAPAWFDASGYAWLIGGNSVSSEQEIGPTNNYALPFITNNTERMRISSTGNVGIGTSTFSGTNPEKLIVDAGSNGAGAYQNVIVGKGNTNSYAQLNIQNSNAGTIASSDVVATANNGSETVNYIDMGINSSVYSATGILGGANNAYLYATGNDFVIGNSTENKDLIFYTTVPTATSTERLRVTGNGVKLSGSFTVGYHSGTGSYTLLATDYVVINTGIAATWTLPTASTCPGRVYRLLNQGTGSITLTPVVRIASGTTSNALVVTAGSNFYEIMSDGTEWRRIN